MENYYSNNELYKYLENTGGRDFVWAVGNSWVLLYGDRNSVVKLIVFVYGSSVKELGASGRDRLNLTKALAKKLAQRAVLPFATIEFDDRSDEITSVVLNDTDTDLSELKDWFATMGLPVVTGGAARKPINDASSSAYHKWQRSALGNIVVTDVDLFRVDPASGNPVSIFELKRSVISLERWTPYQQDYPNFSMLLEVSQLAAVEFYIVYNVRKKNPIFDDVRMLKIFSYSDRGAQLIETIPIERFVRGVSQ